MKRRDNTAGTVGKMVGLLAAVAASQLAHAEPIHYDIPAGDAAKTLQEYLQQTRIEMLYLTEEVRGIATHAIQGDIEPTDALAQLLAGTGLDFTFTPDLTFATVKLHEELAAEGPESAADARSDPSRHNHPSLSRQVSCKSCEGELQQVVVTGTLIHVNSVEDIAAPLEIINQQRISTSSSKTVKAVLEVLPVTRGKEMSEDFGGVGNYARGTAINLRGLGASSTLVLIDGRRQPSSGLNGDFVDVSSIPYASIDRIEVLPDGASAVYGSDAVAGVVNIIMKTHEAGQVTGLSYDAGNSGGSDRYVSQLFTGEWGTGRAMATMEFRERGPLAASARSYTRSADKTSFGGSDFRSPFSTPGNVLDPTTLQPEYGLGLVSPGSAVTTRDMHSTLNLEDRWARPHVDLLPERSSRLAFLSASQNIGELELFTHTRLARQQVTQSLFGVPSILFVPNSNPFIGELANGEALTFLSYDFVADIGPSGVSAKTQTIASEVGANLKVAKNWHASLTGSAGTEETKFVLLNDVDGDALASALASPDPSTAFNPFSPGTSPRSVIDAIRLNVKGQSRSKVRSMNLVVDGPLLRLPAGPLSVAFGAETRDESLSRSLPTSGQFSRTVRSMFGEAKIPIVGGKTDASPRADFTLSGRYEEYSDVGNTFNPRFSVRYMPGDDLKFRASWGTSFRAPKLVDKSLQANFDSLFSLTDPRSPSGQSLTLVLIGNNPHLREETASTWTVGIDVAPHSLAGLTGSLTYYRINYNNRIVTPGPSNSADILLEEDTWADVIQRNPTPGDVAAICSGPEYRGSVEQCETAPVKAIVDFRLRNLAATRVSGLDLKVDQQLSTWFGRVDLGLNAGYMFGFEQATSPEAAWVDVSNTVGNPPRLRALATLDWYETRWDGPGLGASLSVSHTGAYKDGVESGRSVSAATTANLRLRYRTPRHWSLSDTEFSFNANNLFAASPPFVNREAGYDQLNTDPVARTFSFGIEKRW